MQTSVAGPALSVQTCARRLAPHTIAAGGDPAGVDLAWPGGPAGGDVRCEISWWGPDDAADEPGGEALAQAATGLMHLHGRDLGGPRRIGVEIASVAAGMLAAQALLAVAVGRCRGVPVSTVRTSVVQAALLQASHYLAAATCPPEEVPPPAPAPGPPFRTADWRWFEIETFDTEAWKAFWLRLGAPAAELGGAWTRFRPRYYRGTTSLPHGFHEATASRTLAEVTAVARSCGVSLSPVRSYEEVRADPAAAGSLPVFAPLVGGGMPAAGGPAVTPAGLPLAGLEVVEATSRLQGPLAGLLLQMLGARVTRVEAPGGDVGRGVPPLAEGTGSFFLCFNRGKDTVELDLGIPGGRDELAERAAAADVFLHNWRPGKASEWKLAADDLARRNPRLVYAEAAGWSAGSGAAGLIGTDFLVQAWTGLANALHPEPDPPRPSRVLLTDFMGALVTCEGVLGGLYRRELDGHGCRVATSLEAGAMALQAHVLADLGGDEAGDADPGAASSGRSGSGGPPRWGPLDVPVEAADGFLAVAVSGKDLPRLCDLCGVVPRHRPRPDLEREVVQRMAARPVEAWREELHAAGIGCARVATDLASIPADPRLAALFEPLAGTCRAPSSPWLLEP
jgi:crotonobetainyl-CoA:carnitine CoA-transferase CaiB-like acyl-CoA transferase